MTTRLWPAQCSSCVHFRSPFTEGVPKPTWPMGTGSCDAYPDQVDAIPQEIWWNQVDHLQPYEGDHGIQWEAGEDYRNGGKAKFPDRAMAGHAPPPGPASAAALAALRQQRRSRA